MSTVSVALLACVAVGSIWDSSAPGQGAGGAAATEPAKVYVPYDQLKTVFEKEKQGVFLPYQEFQSLWAAAQGAPAAVDGAPVPYLISTARFNGAVGTELAQMQLELTVDILRDGWVEVPLGLSEAAVAKAEFLPENEKADQPKAQPLLRVVDGKYVLLTKGKGRRTLKLEFVRQLITEPGLNVLAFKIPSAAITTLDLEIPQENMKVDVEPMLAATTTQATGKDGGKVTKLQAFLGSADSVKLSWKPKSQAAAELEPVVIADQLQQIHVAEALVNYDIRFDLDVRRRGMDAFTIQLPADYRVTAVDGANISKWDLPESPAGQPQTLQVKLFSPVKDKYTLAVKMERFLKDAAASLPLTPILVQQALRGTGAIAITHSASRSVELRDLKNLARVDIGSLGEGFSANAAGQAGTIAYRFISTDYGATMDIATVQPRINLTQLWALGVSGDALELAGRLEYDVERAGVFQIAMTFPEPWELTSVEGASGANAPTGQAAVVDDHQLSGKGATRTLTVLLKKEMTGRFSIALRARNNRTSPDAPVEFALPLPDATNLHLYNGQVVVYLAEQLRAELQQADQLVALPLGKSVAWTNLAGVAPAMAFEYKAIDQAKPAGLKLKIAVKPTQVSAVVHRLVDIQQGYIQQQAVIQYKVLYAPTDTFYVQLPAAMAKDVQVSGDNIKEKAQIDKLPVNQAAALPAAHAEDQGDLVMLADAPPITGSSTASTEPATLPAGANGSYVIGYSLGDPPSGSKSVYYKVVLQSPVIGGYTLTVDCRQPFVPAPVGHSVDVEVLPILAAGKISDQSGQIAIAKAETLAIVNPSFKGLTPADPASAADLPYEKHRQTASLAFKYDNPPFELTLGVLSQAQAEVITTHARAAIIEQVLALDGALSTHGTFLISTSRGDRLAFTLPEGAKLYEVLLDGMEAQIETGGHPGERLVRLPRAAGQVSRFVLEIKYGLDGVSPARLPSVQFDKDLSVDVTLWRISLPQDTDVLRYDRNFSRPTGPQGEEMLRTLSEGLPNQLQWKLPQQGGQTLVYFKQGPPGELSLYTAGHQTFSILAWIVMIGAGLAMLPLAGRTRLKVVLVAAIALLVVHLYAPDFVRRFASVGTWGAVIVAIMWAGQWLVQASRARVAPAANGPAATPAKIVLPEPPKAPVAPPSAPATPPGDAGDKGNDQGSKA
jgi:hypothetical protein